MPQVYTNAIEMAHRDLAIFRRQRDKLDEKIAQLEKAIALMEPVYKGTTAASIDPVIGPMARVRAVMESNPRKLTAIEVKEYVEASGYPLSQYRNGMAMIHQSLKRLSKKGLVDVKNNGPRRTTYQYVKQAADKQIAMPKEKAS